MKTLFEHSWVLAVYAVFMVFLILLVLKDFLKFRVKADREKHYKSKESFRLFFIVFRAFIFLMIALALASPYVTTKIEIQGDPVLTLLYDNSTSFEPYTGQELNDFVQKIGEKIPVNLKLIASGEMSALGDSILSQLQGGESVLLVTDGNNNYGRSFGDMLGFISVLNSSINALNLNPEKSDAAVSIIGPHDVIANAENTFTVNVVGVKNPVYTLEVLVDNAKVLSQEGTGDQSFELTHTLSLGYHTITANLILDDHFSQNNVYYKTINALPQPELLLVTKKISPLSTLLSRVYRVDTETSLKGADLSKYHAIVIDNIPSKELDPYVDDLTYAVNNGTGLLVFGGRDAFGNQYKISKLQTLLPVKAAGKNVQQEEDVNLVIVIDISGSTGHRFNSETKSSKVDVEKALALEIIKDLRPYDNVAVVAFNKKAFLVSGLSPLNTKTDIYDKVSALQYGGGTLVFSGLEMAKSLLAGAQGSKNIIVISDGHDSYSQKALEIADLLRKTGTKIYTVGIGSGTRIGFMEELSRAGGTGLYFEPEETQKLGLIFGGDDDEPLALEILNTNHFITSELELNTRINGFNELLTKPAAFELISTKDKHPVLSVWRSGLGRVAVFSTDNGNYWSNNLYNGDPSKLIFRTVNWAVGDINKNQEQVVRLNDVFLGEQVDISVVTETTPISEQVIFSKVGRNEYIATFTPPEEGLYTFFDAVLAANYRKEYLKMGMNPELENIVSSTGGKIFTTSDIDAIVHDVKQHTKRTKIDKKYYRWPFIIIALVLFLIELFIRRKREVKGKRVKEHSLKKQENKEQQEEEITDESGN